MLALSLLQAPAGSFDGRDNTQKLEAVFFTIVASGNYPALGDTLDFTGLGDAIKSSQPPLVIVIQSTNPAGSSGYVYAGLPGTTQANGKMQVLVGAAGGPSTDLGAVAYPAGITGDIITGYALFPRI